MSALHSNSKGFSLIEVIVASALFVAIFIVLVQIFPFQKRSIVRSEKSTVATQLAQKELESYNALGYGGLASKMNPGEYDHTFGPETVPDPENNFQFTKVVKISYVDADLNDVNMQTKLIKILVTFKFTQNAQEQKVELTKVVYDI